MTEEAMLFRRVQEGCWEAFDVLFHTYAEQLFFYAMGFVNCLLYTSPSPRDRG